MIHKRVATGVALAIVSSLVGAPAQALAKSELTVTLDGLKDQSGQVCLSLFSGSQGFPGNGKLALKRECFKITDAPVTFTFRNLDAGSYAIAAIHDTNENGTLDRNALGMPIEGFGFSQNPKIQMGPPKFGDAAILVVGNSTAIEIQLQYLAGR